MNQPSDHTLLPSDIVLVDKPKGITSFDVIRQLRKNTGLRKMGHAGTLDPLASGLMIIGIGSGTKKLHDLTKLDKSYDVEVLLGRQTTTGDLDGETVAHAQVESISLDDARTAAAQLVGVLHLPVPAYSAVKRDGVPLYKKARAGMPIELPMRDMHVQSAVVHDVSCADDVCIVRMTMSVESGVYVRSVVEEYGRILHVPATVKELRRTRIGEFYIQQAQNIDDVKV